MIIEGSLNYKEIDCILNELDLPGSRIQEIYQPRPEYLIFELFGKGNRFKLLFVFEPKACRFHLLTRNISNPKKPQRFVSFLRAHIKNGLIRLSEQMGKERIIKMEIHTGNNTLFLWVRLWSAAPNLIVTDQNGIILDALFRRPNRGEISGGIFDPNTLIKASNIPSKPEKKYQVRDFPGQGSFNKRVENFYFLSEYQEKLNLYKSTLLKKMNQAENNLLLKIEALKTLLANEENYERYRELGDIIMSLIPAIKKGDKLFKAENYFDNNKPIEISLQAELTPLENAEYYYKKYKKIKANLIHAHKNLEDFQKELNEIQKQKDHIASSDDLEKLAEMTKKHKISAPAAKYDNLPGLKFLSQGFTIIVGRNAKENEHLLRYHMQGNDYWFHCRDYPGSYVFVKSIKGKTLPLETILDAGSLALVYSKAKNSGKGDVYYTQVKFLKKIKGAKTGLVIPTQEKNLFVSIEKDRLQRLKDSFKVFIEK
jgi:predicted ribosome quality control (RQC) complex YloA/Tae2 family protein